MSTETSKECESSDTDMYYAEILLDLPRLIAVSEFEQAWKSEVQWGAKKKRSIRRRPMNVDRNSSQSVDRVTGTKRKSPESDSMELSQGSLVVLKSDDLPVSKSMGEKLKLPDLNTPIMENNDLTPEPVMMMSHTMVQNGNDNVQISEVQSVGDNFKASIVHGSHDVRVPKLQAGSGNVQVPAVVIKYMRNRSAVSRAPEAAK